MASVDINYDSEVVCGRKYYILLHMCSGIAALIVLYMCLSIYAVVPPVTLGNPYKYWVAVEAKRADVQNFKGYDG